MASSELFLAAVWHSRRRWLFEHVLFALSISFFVLSKGQYCCCYDAAIEVEAEKLAVLHLRLLGYMHEAIHSFSEACGDDLGEQDDWQQ